MARPYFSPEHSSTAAQSADRFPDLSAATATPIASNEVQEQLARLQHQVQSGHEALGELLTRLNPVLKPERPTVDGKSDCSTTPVTQSQLGNEINSLNQQVGQFGMRIKEAIGRLAI